MLSVYHLSANTDKVTEQDSRSPYYRYPESADHTCVYRDVTTVGSVSSLSTPSNVKNTIRKTSGFKNSRFSLSINLMFHPGLSTVYSTNNLVTHIYNSSFSLKQVRV